MADKPRLLILNGRFSEITLIEAAHKLGYYVITSGNAPQLIGHQYADEYIGADYSDKDAILQLVKNNHVDRIVSCANDFGVITASYVAEKMGWPGHDTYENAQILHQKDLFRYLNLALAHLSKIICELLPFKYPIIPDTEYFGGISISI